MTVPKGKKRRLTKRAIVSLALIFIFISSMAIVYLNKGGNNIVGRVSVAREEVFYQFVRSDSQQIESRYLVNYAMAVYASSTTMTMTDKGPPNLQQVEIPQAYPNVVTSYDPTSGEIKVTATNIVTGQNYNIQMQFNYTRQDMFDGPAPDITVTPAPTYGYKGNLTVDISAFKLNNADRLYETNIYLWFNELSTNQTILASSPPAYAQKPAWEAMWLYSNNSTASLDPRSATYSVTVGDQSLGRYLLRVWVEMHNRQSILMKGETATFSGVTDSYIRDTGRGYTWEYDYAIA